MNELLSLKHGAVLGFFASCAIACTGSIAQKPVALPVSKVTSKKHEPPRTAPPPKEPSLLLYVRLGSILQKLEQHFANYGLDSSLVQPLLPFDNVLLDQPILAAGHGSQATMFAYSTKPISELELGAPNDELDRLGLSALERPGCAVQKTKGKGPATALCAAPENLLSLGSAVLARYRSAARASDIEAEFTIKSEELAALVFGVRASVPRRVDALLAPLATLRSNFLAVSALSEFGYDHSFALTETYEKAGRVRGALSLDGDGGAHYEFSAEPEAGTRVHAAITRAEALVAPSFLFDLPIETEHAFFTATGTLRALFEPSKRGLNLLQRVAEVPGEGQLALRLGEVFEACTQAEAAIVLVNAKDYDLVGIQDRRGTCGKSVALLLRSYTEFAGKSQKIGARGASVALLRASKALPKADVALELGSDEGEKSTLLSVHANGVTWLGYAPTPESLSRPVRAVTNVNDATIKRLRERKELAPLRDKKMFVGGFVAGLNLFGGKAQKSETTATTELPRVPLSLVAEGSRLVLSGSIQRATVGHMVAHVIDDLTSRTAVTALSEAKRDAYAKALGVACRLGADTACNRLGVMYMDGSGIAKDVAKAQELFAKSCSRDEAMACVNLGFSHAEGRPDEALRLFQRACDLNEPFGCAWYGERLLLSEKVEQQKLAVKKLEYACGKQIAFACLGLASSYKEGHGVDADPAKSASYYEQACRLGHGIGCVGLGTAYCQGAGRNKDPELCFDLYERACELNKGVGCYVLGAAYVNGIGTRKDPQAARKQFETACDAGHAPACKVLDDMGGR